MKKEIASENANENLLLAVVVGAMVSATMSIPTPNSSGSQKSDPVSTACYLISAGMLKD
ncbi:MAG: hypothetical protein U5L72_15010 [Bacteroidales bacterium]|nr:hypothetical protein [Bacteroidales bacterium]